MRADPVTGRGAKASFQEMFYLNCLSGAVFLKVCSREHNSLDYYYCGDGGGKMGLCSNEFGKPWIKVKQLFLKDLKNE